MTDSPDPMLGQSIHGYQLYRRLSGDADKGGFGDVYFARHASGAEAVVKLLKSQWNAQRDIVTRFLHEAEAAARIRHPGIVAVHNVGFHHDRAFLLMERLYGEDLEARMGRERLTIERALLFLRQTAGAIGAAHAQQIVHRDLKPANLFVVADPDVVGGERIKVLDFGIAKLSEPGNTNSTRGVFGTPTYMSPEQCQHTGNVDHRSDLYALGCIAYEMLCGRPPFGHGGVELIAAHLRDAPVPPRALAPWIPPELEALVMRLLEKQPERRPQSCAELVASLDGIQALSGSHAAASLAPAMHAGGYGAASGAYASGHPSTGQHGGPHGSPSTMPAGAVGAGPSLPRASGRAGLYAALAGVVIAAGIVVAIVASGGEPSSSASPANGPAGDAGPADRGPAAPPQKPAAPPSTPPAGGLARIELTEGERRAVAEATARAEAAAGAARWTEAITAYREAAAASHDPALLGVIAAAYEQAGEPGPALKYYRWYVLVAPDAPARPAIDKRIGALEAAQPATRPPAAVAALFSSDPRIKDEKKARSFAKAAYEQGSVAYNLGKFDDAIASFSRAYLQWPTPEFLFNIAQAYRQKGDLQSALYLYKRYLALSPGSKARPEIEKRIAELTTQLATAPVNASGSAPVDKESLARYHNDRGLALFELGRWDESIAAFNRSRDADQSAATLLNLAHTYRRKGEAREALPLYREYLAMVPDAANRAALETVIRELETQLGGAGQ